MNNTGWVPSGHTSSSSHVRLKKKNTSVLEAFNTSALKTIHMAGFGLIQNEGESCVHVVLQISTRNDPVQRKAPQDEVTGNFPQV